MHCSPCTKTSRPVHFIAEGCRKAKQRWKRFLTTLFVDAGSTRVYATVTSSDGIEALKAAVVSATYNNPLS